MDEDLANIIRQTLADAKDAGKDYLSQTEHAVALAAVNLVQRS